MMIDEIIKGGEVMFIEEEMKSRWDDRKIMWDKVDGKVEVEIGNDKLEDEIEILKVRRWKERRLFLILRNNGKERMKNNIEKMRE